MKENISLFPARLVRICYDKLTIVGCAIIFLLMYVIVWVTTFDRLTTDSIREKARIAATMVTLSHADIATAQKAMDGLEPTILKQNFFFHPLTVGDRTLTAGELKGEMVKAASELSFLGEDDPSFVSTLLRYDVCANQLRGTESSETTAGTWFSGEHDRTGCGVRIAMAESGSLRESAGLFLRYNDAFADASPRGNLSPLSDPALIHLVGEKDAKEVRRAAIRVIPLTVMAAPWQMFRFCDPNFAALCAESPREIMFLALAFYFISELHFASVGKHGLFAKSAVPAKLKGWVILVTGGVLFVVVLAVEGRETPSELLRLPALIVALLAAGSLIYCLIAMNQNPLSKEFVTLDFVHRQRRLLPFNLGIACLFAGTIWGLKYSVFQLALRFDPGSFLRGLAQTCLLLWMLYLLLRVASRLWNVEASHHPASQTIPALDDSASFYHELAKALALILPPVALQLLNWLTMT